MAKAARLFVGLRSADGFVGYKRLLGDDPLDRSIAAALQSLPGAVSVDQYWQMVEERNQYCQRFLSALDAQRFDALLCPPYALPAPTHESSGALNVTNAGSYAILYNLLGFAAGVAPVTRVQPGEESERSVGNDSLERAAQAVEMNSAGLPVGVQVAARPWREDIVLALMEALEEKTAVGMPIWKDSQFA
ncbi:amidase family protein [Ktedonosporobacter rubrisoli]|uniref:amidase family protein n=1 Tax=Ktedonosporobacter rubrisoli TaxID=2509675 RepID=UPI0013EEB3A5|nr:amidase family protein [Ktedonosporobacter rubrisoli]